MFERGHQDPNKDRERRSYDDTTSHGSHSQQGNEPQGGNRRETGDERHGTQPEKRVPKRK